MRYVVSTALVLVAISAGTAQPAEPLTDEEIETRIIGEWRDVADLATGHLQTTDTTYREDGTLRRDKILSSRGQVLHASTHSGTWKVLDGKVIETYDEPLPLNKKYISEFTIVEINDKEFRIEISSSLLIKQKRIPTVRRPPPSR